MLLVGGKLEKKTDVIEGTLNLGAEKRLMCFVCCY